MKQKIGLYGGTFDPIHFGHLNVAFELMEKAHLDEVWFIPVHVNPLKQHAPPVSIEHRLEMLRLAIADIPFFHVKDFESRRPPPSYTIDTVRDILDEEAKRPVQRQFYLMLGEDAIPGFVRWHQPEQIVEIIPLLIATRAGNGRDHVREDNSAIGQAIRKGLVQTNLFDISSTDLRERLQTNRYCGHLIPNKTLDYIHKKRLYK